MPQRVVIRKDMAYNHRDMIAGVRRAFGDAVNEADGALHVDLGDGRLTVSMGTETIRHLALMKILHMPVTLTFDGVDDAARAAALVRFDRAFQRGGG
jgi:hypothetical protein